MSHVLERGEVHPVQSDLRLMEEARRRMRSKVVENVAGPVANIYNEVYEEMLGMCEGADREELVAFFPILRAMERHPYRWRKEGGLENILSLYSLSVYQP